MNENSTIQVDETDDELSDYDATALAIMDKHALSEYEFDHIYERMLHDTRENGIDAMQAIFDYVVSQLEWE